MEEYFIHKELMALMKKPELNAPSTIISNYALWSDEHISKCMLESHLNPDEEGATSRHDFVSKSVQWIAEIAPLARHTHLLDLGCGPGVYAERFVKAGYSVTGVDFSKCSIEYAKEQTELNGSGIEYHLQNYLTIDFTERFDVITIINKDYPVLSIADRTTLLKKVYQALKPGGKFIFDAFTPKMRAKESRTWRFSENGGFMCYKPHLILEAVYQYDDEDKTELHQNIIVTDEGVNCINIWIHYLSKELLLSETLPIGFDKVDFFGNIAGEKYSDEGEIICAVITKR